MNNLFMELSWDYPIAPGCSVNLVYYNFRVSRPMNNNFDPYPFETIPKDCYVYRFFVA